MKEKFYKIHRIEARSVEYQSWGWTAGAVVEWREQGHAHTFRLHHPKGSSFLIQELEDPCFYLL